MAKVFTGRVVIPGDKINEYFEALQQAEESRAPFRKSLGQLNQEFGEYLATKYVPKTVRKHTGIVDLFIHFICGYTDAHVTHGYGYSIYFVKSPCLIKHIFCIQGLNGKT